MKPKHLPLLVTALLISCLANAQQYLCEYDAAGNRVKRYYTNIPHGRSAVIPLEEDTVYVTTRALPLDEDYLLTNSIPSTEETAYIPTAVFPELNNNSDPQEEANVSNAQEPEPFRMVIYPNPTTGYFTLELPGLQAETIGNLMILSNMGQLVYSQNRLTQIQAININSAPAGLYLIRIITGNKQYVVSIIKN